MPRVEELEVLYFMLLCAGVNHYYMDFKSNITARVTIAYYNSYGCMKSEFFYFRSYALLVGFHSGFFLAHHSLM